MIEFFSSWIKTLGLSIVIVSILEMLLPNNKNKKYIRMVMGLYVLFTMISPFISNKEIFNIQENLQNIDFEDYSSKQTSSIINSNVNQTSMNQRIQELYEEELEKDIEKKIKNQGYEVKNCKVNAKITDNKEETQITKIKIKIAKLKIEDETKNIENQVVTQIQKIKPIDISINKQNENKNQNKTEENVDKTDIQNIKKFLIEEYGVNEKCLEIN